MEKEGTRMNLDSMLAELGLPDDLADAGLEGAPEPDAAAVDRIRRRALQAVVEQKRPGRGQRPWTWVAAAAVLILALGLPSGLGWMQGVLRLVPGFGLRSPTSFQRALGHPVRVRAGQDTIYVTGVVATSQWTLVNFSIIGPDAAGNYGRILLVDGNGNAYRPTGGSWSYGIGTETSGTGSYEFPSLKAPASRLTMVLPMHSPVRIALTLVQATNLASVRTLSHGTAQGITIGAEAASRQGGLQLTLVAEQAPAGLKVSSFGDWNRPVRLLYQGKSVAIQAVQGFESPIQLYTGQALPFSAKSALVIVPTLQAALSGTFSVHVPVPVHGSLRLNQVLQVGPAFVRFTKVERLSGNRLRVTVDQSGPAEVMFPAFLPAGYQGGAQGRLDRAGGLHTITFQIPAGHWSVTLQAADPSLVIQGPWRIAVPVGK
jgi:hypothetical protein